MTKEAAPSSMGRLRRLHKRLEELMFDWIPPLLAFYVLHLTLRFILGDPLWWEPQMKDGVWMMLYVFFFRLGFSGLLLLGRDLSYPRYLCPAQVSLGLIPLALARAILAGELRQLLMDWLGSIGLFGAVLFGAHHSWSQALRTELSWWYLFGGAILALASLLAS